MTTIDALVDDVSALPDSIRDTLDEISDVGEKVGETIGETIEEGANIEDDILLETEMATVGKTERSKSLRKSPSRRSQKSTRRVTKGKKQSTLKKQKRKGKGKGKRGSARQRRN